MFIEKFNEFYEPKLSLPFAENTNLCRDRASGFKLLFENLNDAKDVVFVETGTTRTPFPAYNTDGSATLIFDDYVQVNGGVVYSVDIDANSCELARRQVSDKVKIYQNDSVNFLWNYDGPPIDVLYLDSFDFEEDDVDQQNESKFHHVKELMAAGRHLKNGSIIMIDDHDALLDGSGEGKGSWVKEFMEDINAEKLHEGYQIMWRWNID
tara:strand:- start:70 stop:696 length:627 start_codon:yes stop_codon:yes gene_type:complete